jgi:superfamily II DNA/RNA helicase
MPPTPPVDRDTLASQYFDLLRHEPYPVQEEALLAYFTGDEDGYQGVLVCAPTGTGKTLIAEAAVFEALSTRKRMYYTTPLIALTDQKFDELRLSAVRWGFSADDVGLVTGNRSVNPDALVLVVVAEILLNRLLNPEGFSFDNVDSVVMDEFHSFNDRERGIVWELTLALLPKPVRTLLLSATVGNAIEFTSWLFRSHDRRLKLVSGTERKVPLEYSWVDDLLLPEIAEKLAEGDEIARRTPALMFCFSRAQCWNHADLLKGKSMIDKTRQAAISDIIAPIDLSQGAGPKLKALLLRGIGVHHAGVLPKYRRIVETLFQQKLLGFCICTETLAAGINLPARSVILPTILKGPKDKLKLIDAASAQQIFGRAGRPQYDDRGYIFALAHEDDVKLNRWREKYDSIPEDTKDPGLLKAKKQLKKKMPKRSAEETYWSQEQFNQLAASASANLASRGQWPWRLLAYLLSVDPHLDPIRIMIGKRLLPPAGIENAQKDLNRMLITLWTAGYVELDPKPRPASVKGPTPKGGDPKSPPKPTAGLFGSILDQMKATDPSSISHEPELKGDDDPLLIQSRGYEVEDYRPITAKPTDRLNQLVHVKSVNPLLGVYVSNLLAFADPLERVAVLESLLEVPGTVARYARVPGADELPPGTLTTTHLDPTLLQLGLASPEELGQKKEEDENDRRGIFDEPKVWPLTIGEKVLRLFRHEFPRVDNVQVQPVWIVGRLMEFDFNFNNYITTATLQKEEGLIFRHCLRMILLLDEMANIPPSESTVETWEDWMDDLADRLTDMCRKVDPQSTDEILVPGQVNDDLIGPGRRKK